MPHTESAWVYYVRVLAFLLHFGSAIFISVVAVKCGGSFIYNTFAEIMPAVPAGYPVLVDAPCQGSCFFNTSQTYDAAQIGMEWNVFALLAAFEWVSASFALGHLRPGPNPGLYVWIICAWNLAGALLLLPWAAPMSTLQAGVTVLSLLVATVVQVNPVKGAFEPGRVVMHYLEYCTSAALLLVSVSILFLPYGPSWTYVVGFVSLVLCNLCGVAAHMNLVDPGEPSHLPEVYDFNWVRVRNHFKLFLAYAWVALLMGVLTIVYTSRTWIGESSVPWWVHAILYTLLITYCLFGVWATVCYVVADLMGPAAGQWWVSECLGTGLIVLSLSAKLPVVYSVFWGLVAAPDGPKLCVF